MINKSNYFAVFVALLASLLMGCGGYELLSPEELLRRDRKVRKETAVQIEARMTNEFARKEIGIRKDARRKLMAELEAVKIPKAPPNNNLRNTRWGMSQEEVIVAEGSGLIKRTKSSIIYKVHTAGLLSIIKYGFKGDRLVKANIYFSNPKLSSVLPIKSAISCEADFRRMHDLLSEKYGSAEITTQQISNIEDLLRKQERLDDTLIQYQRQLKDLQRDYNRKRSELLKQFKGWRDRDHQVQRRLVDKEKQAQRLEDWIVEIKRKQADIEPKIREEQYNQRDGKLPTTTICRWYRPSLFDISLSWSTSSQGAFLSARYNGFITPNLSAAPSDF